MSKSDKNTNEKLDKVEFARFKTVVDERLNAIVKTINGVVPDKNGNILVNTLNTDTSSFVKEINGVKPVNGKISIPTVSVDTSKLATKTELTPITNKLNDQASKLETTMSQLVTNVLDLQVSIENFPIIVPESSDSPRIQRALDYCELHSIGKLKAKGEYTLGSSINLPSNIVIEGLSPIHTRFWLNKGVTAFDVNGKRNVTLKDFAIDGEGKAGTKAFNSHGESVTVVFDNVWIDSVQIGVDFEYTYFINMKNVRTMGTPIPYLFRNSTNVVNMENCSSVVPPTIANMEYSGYVITAFNGSCLNIRGCAFEGEGGRINVFNWNGLSIDAVYHENQSGIQGDAYVTLGNGKGRAVRGVSIVGCNFVGGFRTAVSLISVEGVSIYGNTFDTDVAGFEYYQYDNSPKFDLNLGQNAFKAGIKRVIYLGDTNDNLNSNETNNQLNPLNFKKQRPPQPTHLESEDAVIFNDGAKLKTTKKELDGSTFTLPLMTGETGFVTLKKGVKRISIPHSLGVKPNVYLCTPSGNIGSWWIEDKNERSILFACFEMPSVDTEICWYVNRV